MKTAIGFLLCIVSFCFLPTMPSSAQDKALRPDKFPKPLFTPYVLDQPLSDRAPRYRFPGKKASQYTAEDWGKLIDSTWGPGQTAAEQLNVFDTFWSLIDQRWAGFPNLPLNWDSLLAVYRPQIGSGLSRGRFYALMSRMWLALAEPHTYISDAHVDWTFGSNSFQYRRGVPLLCIGEKGLDLLGAPVTPMPDSSSLVYRIAPGNPLGLEPGDLVLGYEGIPWKQLYRQLLDAGVPVSCLYAYSTPGATPEALTYAFLSCVGRNWGMFDTIDVVKYSSGDTLHLPTAPLATLSQTVWATGQVPIAGVPMPQGVGTTAVSWGVVQGTNIGYVYVWDWVTASTPQLFHDAIYVLLYNKKVDGLVIDFRTNWGGDYSYANGGLSELFNFDPVSNMSIASRNVSSSHFAFTLHSFGDTPESIPSYIFTPTACPFDRPIAVLIGPACLSAGDYNAFRMRFHPMARSFGKPTNGAFVGGDYLSGSLNGGWQYQVPTSIVNSNVLGEGYLIHKGVQPDEEVWLTRDGVARGEDDVVKRALQWINSLSYAHDVAVTPGYGRPGLDSVGITATLTNPLQHTVALSAIVTDTSGVGRDSVLLYNDGLHGDESAGDSVWGGHIRVPSDENVFSVSMRTDDVTQQTFRRLTNAVGFATAGPLTLDTAVVTQSDDGYTIKPYLKNKGTTFTISDVSVSLSCVDPGDADIAPPALGLPSAIPPGGVVSPGGVFYVYTTPTFPGYFNLKFEMSTKGFVCWTDSTRLTVPVEGVEAQEPLPTAYALRQNYPNPFNPSTTIKYELPTSANVSLSVFDMLGREVSVLVNERMDAGVHEVKFDGSNIASGVYFYRLQAGDFVQSRKLTILK